METKEADKSANDHVYTAYIENSYQRKDENEKIFVVYEVVVKDEVTNSTSKFETRYSELHDLNAKLKAEFPKAKLPAFPSKSLFSLTNEQHKMRQKQLEKYLQDVVSNTTFHKSKVFMDFIRGNKEKKISSMPPSPYVARSIEQTAHMQGTGNYARVTIPSVILLGESKEECYCLQYFTHLQFEIECCSDPYGKLSILERATSKLTSEIVTLVEEHQVISRLLTEPKVQHSVPLYQYLQVCLDQIERAMKWQAEIEQTILNYLISSPPTHTITPTVENTESLDARIAMYSNEAGQLIQSSLDGVDNKKKLAALSKQIEKDLMFCRSSKMLQEQYEDTLKNLAEAIDTILGNTKKEEGLEQSVMEFERKLFASIEAAHAAKTEDDIHRVREQLTDLMKESASLKSSIRKSIGLQSQEKEVPLLNRMEDLQENLAELDHSISRLSTGSSSLTLKAHNLYKSKQVEDAERQHRKVSDELFQL